MGHADNTKAAYHVMQGLNVSLYDLELWGLVEGMADQLTVAPEAAFDRLIEEGFSLGEGGSIEHYYQATADYVSEALTKRGLMKDEDVTIPVLEQARAVERGEAPSGSVVMKLTGQNSLHTPGPDHVCDLRTDGAGPAYQVSRAACPACPND